MLSVFPFITSLWGVTPGDPGPPRRSLDPRAQRSRYRNGEGHPAPAGVDPDPRFRVRG